MRILKKLAAAVAVVVAVSSLSGCGDDDSLFYPEMNYLPDASQDPAGALEWIIDQLQTQVVKSRVTSADSTAKELITTVNTWIASNVAAGGDEKYTCELSISMNNGKAAITDNTGKNDWEARRGCPESLEELFESDYSARTFTAKVFIDSSGYAVYSWCVPDNGSYIGAAPKYDDFWYGAYGWGSQTEGMTSDGTVIGTSPKLYQKGGSSFW